MSKKHRKRHNAVLEPTRPLASLIMPPRPVRLSPIEDRRLHHPLGKARPAKQVSGHPVKPHVVKPVKRRVVVKRGPGGRPMRSTRIVSIQTVPSRIRFASPKRTLICLKRKIRAEVLHAFKKTGRGSPRKRHSRRNFHSSVSC